MTKKTNHITVNNRKDDKVGVFEVKICKKKINLKNRQHKHDILTYGLDFSEVIPSDW